MIKNRTDAGKRLGDKLSEVVDGKNSLVLAIPRGGVVVGEEIAKRLSCPLDVIISKKITPPSYQEYAIGAITHDETIYRSENWEKYSKEPNFEEEVQKKKLEAKRRLEEYRKSTNYNFDDKTVILVDDGIATGATVFVLIKWLSEHKVKRIILAVPVIPASTYEEMKSLVDDIVALEIPTEFHSVGEFYKEFDQVSDDIVISILDKFKQF